MFDKSNTACKVELTRPGVRAASELVAKCPRDVSGANDYVSNDKGVGARGFEPPLVDLTFLAPKTRESYFEIWGFLQDVDREKVP